MMTPTMYIMAGLSLIILLMGGAGYWYFTYSQNQLSQLNQELAARRVEVEQVKQTLEMMSENQEQIKDGFTDLFVVFSKTQADVEDLREKFNKDDRDFGFLAYNKPALVEKIVNKATKKAFRCVELRTGAKPSELEKSEYEKTGDFAVCNY